MKLRQVMLEDGFAVTFNHLTSGEIGVLRKIEAGKLSDESATPLQLAIMDRLRDLRLLDTYGELTDGGRRAAEMAKRHLPHDQRDARKLDAALGRQGGRAQRYTDVDDGTDVQADEPGGFQNQWSGIAKNDDDL